MPSVIKHVEKDSRIFNRINDLVEMSLIANMQLEILNLQILQNAEKNSGICENLKAIVASGLVSNIIIEFKSDGIADEEDVDLALVLAYFKKFIEACKERATDNVNLFSSKAYNIYHYRSFNKTENQLAFKQEEKNVQFASAEFKAYRFINLTTKELGSQKLYYLSHIYDNMVAAGYCYGEVDVYSHQDLAIIGLNSEVINQALMEELAGLILTNIEQIKQKKKYFPNDSSIYCANIEDIKNKVANYPFSWKQVCDYMLTNYNSKEVKLIMQ